MQNECPKCYRGSPMALLLELSNQIITTRVLNNNYRIYSCTKSEGIQTTYEADGWKTGKSNF